MGVGWVHTNPYYTCVQTWTDGLYHLFISECVSVLSLICSSFGWIMCSRAQHANLIPSPPLMPTRLYQISFSFSLSLLPFSISPFLYPHRNVWYVDQQTGCVIFLLSSGEKAGWGRGGEKQPRCHLHSRILHHLSARPNDNHTPNLLLWPFTSMPSNSRARRPIRYIWQGMWNRITDHLGTRKVLHLDFLPWINLQRWC